MWWFDILKRIEKIVQESAFDKKKKEPELKFARMIWLQVGMHTVLAIPRSWNVYFSAFFELFKI